MASIGFVLSSEQFSPKDLVEFGAAAERAGFDMVWMSDHFHPWQDNQGHGGQAWVTLAALGQRLERIPMGTGVTCPTYRYHPAVVAQSFATLGVLYPGRIFLGVGSGEAINEQAVTGRWDAYEERGSRLEEAVTLIRKLWTGAWISHEGEYYQVNAKLYDIPKQMIPIYIAASGEKSMRLAGEHGDGLITSAETAQKAEKVQPFRQEAQVAGKDSAQLPISAETWAFVGKRKDAEPAAEKWRFTVKTWEKFVHNPDPRDIQRQADKEIPLEKAMQEWVITDDPMVHIAALQKLIDNGITNIFVHSAQDDQLGFIRFFGEKVLPNLDHQIMQPRAAMQMEQEM